MRLPIFQTRTWRFTSFCLLTLTTWTAYTQLYSSSNSAISQEPIATLESCIPDHIVPNKANLITISCRNHNTIGLPYSTFRLRCKNPTGWIIQVPTGLETSQACGQDEVCEQLNITPGFADAFIFSVRPPIAASQGELTWVLDVMNDRREWQEVATRQHTLRVFPTQEKKQLIIDTDPAMGRYNVNDPDDALAFIQAYSSNNEIKGVTVTWGNLFIRRLAALCFPDNYKPELDMMSPIDVAYANAQEACSWVGKLCATDNPWSFTCPNSRGHYSIVKGADYGAPPSLPDHASEYLVKAVAQAPGVITIIALGNLTNIANAMRRDPSFADNIREIYIVAGLFFLPLPEWNIWFDADAAEYVLKRVRRATLIPFDATMDYKFPASDVELIKPVTRFDIC